jgi:hypothetical protein
VEVPAAGAALAGAVPALGVAIEAPRAALPVGAPSAALPVGAAPTPIPTGAAPAEGQAAPTADRPAPSPGARSFDLPDDRVTFGAYDPWQAFAGLPLELEHWYVPQDRADLLAGVLARARDRRALLVTVEPYPPAGAPGGVLEAVAAGRADAEVRRLARAARDARPPALLLRWGHEMELHDLYPWSAQDPAAYRAAYRRVVALFREEGATNVRWVWSPAGNPEAALYYPGDDVVDYVGLTVLGDSGWDAAFGMTPQSFAELLAPKHAFAARFGKPLLIAELGVSGPPERQREWLLAAAATLAEYPRVRAVSYFADANAPNNRLRDQPDWRVAPADYAAFVGAAEARRAQGGSAASTPGGRARAS